MKIDISKRKVAAILAGAAVFAAVSASASTLGGLQTDQLGANSNTVGAQVTKGVSLSWKVAYSSIAKAYVVSGIVLATLDPTEKIPSGAKIQVTLNDSSGASLAEYISSDGGKTWSPAPTSVSANSVTGASVVINGGPVTAAVAGK